MAEAAILKIDQWLQISQLWPDFDDIWYTDWTTHAEFEYNRTEGSLAVSKMADAAILRTSERAINKSFMTRFWWTLVHRLNNTFRVRLSQNRKSIVFFQDGRRRVLRSQWNSCRLVSYNSFLRKFDTQTEQHMPSSSITRPEVQCLFPRWPTPPSWKSINGCRSVNCDPILMKVDTQTKQHMSSLNILKPEVHDHFPRWPTPSSWKSMSGCRIVNCYLIHMKIDTQTEQHMSSSIITEPKVHDHFTRWPTPPSWKSIIGCRLVIYDPISMKFDSQTKQDMSSPNNF